MADANHQHDFDTSQIDQNASSESKPVITTTNISSQMEATTHEELNSDRPTKGQSVPDTGLLGVTPVEQRDRTGFQPSRTRRKTAGERSNDNNLSSEGYFPSDLSRSPSSRRTWRSDGLTSNVSSFNSLHGLSQPEGVDMTQTVRRSQSIRSNPTPGHARGRSTSSAAKMPYSPSTPKRPLAHEPYPFYPDQSFASIQHPVLPSRPHPVLRTRSSHPAQNVLYNDIAKHSKPLPNAGRKTADNTPMSSPGLFAPQHVRAAQDLRAAQLHHLQTPRETSVAEVEHDTFSGNKFINNYEVMRELGRGEHGKVKLGRDIERDSFVAIKIVPRYSAKRRLGRLGAPEDRTKKEVAILKKARHPNVVSLLEVIDDPNKNKVYLILEYVDCGEIRWRKRGVREINSIANRRFDLESRGVWLSVDPTEHDLHLVRAAKIRHDQYESYRQGRFDHVPHWSLEYSGDTDEESDYLDPSRPLSRVPTHASGPLRGLSGDDYVGVGDHFDLLQHYEQRKFSVAASAVSHMSSEHAFEYEDDQHSYVPALTLEEARRAFRDTLLGLEFLHFLGIIHRDIKPANLLVSSTGQAKISDFGVSYLGRPISHDVDEEHKVAEADTQAFALDDEKELARSVGTPAFWAPELCYEDSSIFADGKEPKITGALDLWALGITLYCMIYARLPFFSDDNMGLHEAVCTAEVICPKTRLVAVVMPPEDDSAEVTSAHKRRDFELKFEVVPDELRSLINLLLTKDPARRITIAEAKRHPWTRDGIADYSEWLQGPLEKEGKKRILEPNEKELSHAVVKRNLFERALTTAGKLAGQLLGRKAGRDRSVSSASAGGSSTESLSPTYFGSNVPGKHEPRSKEQRRTSLTGDEVIPALKASRDPSTEHPLAQSQTASPEARSTEPTSYFSRDRNVYSAGATPLHESAERRPRGPDRAISALSTADSIRTIRASQYGRPTLDELGTPGIDQSLRSRVEGLWEGTAKAMARLASRERDSRSRSTSRPRSETDGHAGASIAVSNTYAAGAIQTPNALRAVDTPALESQSSQSSQASSISPVHELPRASFPAPTSSDAEYERGQQINQRRQIREAQDRAAAAAAADAASKQEGRIAAEAFCPPSPDDITSDAPPSLSAVSSAQASPVPLEGVMQTAASASTIASSIDAFDNSSLSNPSHGGASGASSPPDHFLSQEKLPTQSSDIEPEHMRTADTVTGRPMIALGKPLEQEHEYYDGDDDGGSDHDDDGSSGDEDLVMMGGNISRPRS